MIFTSARLVTEHFGCNGICNTDKNVGRRIVAEKMTEFGVKSCIVPIIGWISV